MLQSLHIQKCWHPFLTSVSPNCHTLSFLSKLLLASCISSLSPRLPACPIFTTHFIINQMHSLHQRLRDGVCQRRYFPNIFSSLGCFFLFWAHSLTLLHFSLLDNLPILLKCWKSPFLSLANFLFPCIGEEAEYSLVIPTLMSKCYYHFLNFVSKSLHFQQSSNFLSCQLI